MNLWLHALGHVALLYVVYQLLGTIRHELSHAVAGKIQGLPIEKIQIFPSVVNGRFYWGYVLWGETDLKPAMQVYLAPYYLDLIWPFGAHLILQFVSFDGLSEFWTFHLRLAAVMFFLVSAVIDILYNFVVKGLIQKRGDFARAFGWGR